MPAEPQALRLQIATGFASDIGRRADNQDFAAACLDEDRRHHGLVAAVADGVGGYKGGRVAAELAVRCFIDDYLCQSAALSPQKTAARALESVNHWIFQQGHKDEKLKGMCAVFTGIVVKGHRLHSFHVGDTRLYRLREGLLTLLTTDHKPEGQEESHFITRAVGKEEGLRIDYRVFDVQPHDRLLLSSDGLHGTLNTTQIFSMLSLRASPDETASRLVSGAIERGADDNTTALVIDILELPPATIKDLDAAMAALPILDPPKTGEVVDGFRMTKRLLDSDFSRVFKARDLQEPRDVLLKFPKPDTIGSVQSARSTFARQAWIASRVQHVWVGSVINLPSRRQTSLYNVQPFYEGETLESRLLRQPRLSLEEGLDIGLKLAKAVGALHRAGIIHRDIKPDNIIIQPDGGLKLIDLGAARLPNLDAEKEAGHIPGTASYKAPELFTGSPGDERSDIFAVGVTLYRMFTSGGYPYGEIEPFTKPRLGKAERLCVKRPDLPAWLENIVYKTVQIDADARYQDGFELAYALEQGTLSTAPAPQGQRAWWIRNPVKLWQLISLLLALALVTSLALH